MKTYMLPGYYMPGLSLHGFEPDPKPEADIVYPDEKQTVVDLAESPDSYRVKAVCLNCKWTGQLRLR
jgi:hypothetical protein